VQAYQQAYSHVREIIKLTALRFESHSGSWFSYFSSHRYKVVDCYHSFAHE